MEQTNIERFNLSKDGYNGFLRNKVVEVENLLRAKSINPATLPWYKRRHFYINTYLFDLTSSTETNYRNCKSYNPKQMVHVIERLDHICVYATKLENKRIKKQEKVLKKQNKYLEKIEAMAVANTLSLSLSSNKTSFDECKPLRIIEEMKRWAEAQKRYK